MNLDEGGEGSPLSGLARLIPGLPPSPRRRGLFGSEYDRFMAERRPSVAQLFALADRRRGGGAAPAAGERLDVMGLPARPQLRQVATDNQGFRQRYLGQNEQGARVWGDADAVGGGVDAPAVGELVVTAPRHSFWRDLGRGDLGGATRDVQTALSKLRGGGGGVYGDVGLGLGPGFNLHFDRDGVTASAGAGVFGRAQVGYAPTAQALRDVALENRAFIEGKVDGERLGADLQYDRKGVKAKVSAGPLDVPVYDHGKWLGVPGVTIDVDRSSRHSPAVAVSPGALSFGVSGGGGWLHTLNPRN